jgi:hypothetical protein
MANYVLKRSDLFPVGTTVGAYPNATPAAGHDGAPPGTATESQVVDAAGTATFTTLTTDTPYVFSANVAGAWPKVRGRVGTPLDSGRTVGTGDITNGAATVANAAATVGTWRVGQRITGTGIPVGTYIRNISGATLTMSNNATATTVGVALEGHRGLAWSAKVAQRRNAIGTS